MTKEYEEMAENLLKRLNASFDSNTHFNTVFRETLKDVAQALSQAASEARREAFEETEQISQMNWLNYTNGRNHPEYDRGWHDASERIQKAIRNRQGEGKR